MTQSKDDNEYTIDLSNMNGTTDTITITGTNDMDSIWVSVGDITTSTIDIDSIISSNDNITFDWDNINITPTTFCIGAFSTSDNNFVSSIVSNVVMGYSVIF